MKESHMRTKLAHTGDLKLAKKIQSSVSVPKVLPIYMSSVFTFDDVPSLDAVYAGEADGYVYSRMTNPSTDAAEEMLAAAEGADGALVFSSGMAAIINAIIANVQAGDHIAGGEQGASALIRECSTIKFVPSLASFATTISYPAKTSHRAYSPEDMKAAGISMGQLRFSIGLEDAEDIIAELDEALEKV